MGVEKVARSGPILPWRRRLGFRIAKWALAISLVLIVLCWLIMIRMPGESHQGPLPPLSEKQVSLAKELRNDVEALASLGERSTRRPRALEQGARLAHDTLSAAGHAVSRQTYTVNGTACDNVEVRIPGKSDEAVVVGAHYDSEHGTPGANDNGSGVAVLFALARHFEPRTKPNRELRLVAFVNEEMPHFVRGTMGSQHYASQARKAGDRIVAMLSLETMGYYSDEPKSQHYPPPVGLFYPDQGNFLGFVGDLRSRALLRRSIGTFRKHARFPSEGAALPRWLPGVGWSDHRSFWHEGYPAIMLTDTAPFRYPHYHRATDTPDRIDYERLARVVEGVVAVVEDLLDK